MITEVAILSIRENESDDFEAAFKKAQKIISKRNGYIEHELQKCVEQKDKYILIVRWRSMEDHTDGFRKSHEYHQWKELLHHFYDPFPTVEHYDKIF